MSLAPIALLERLGFISCASLLWGLVLVPHSVSAQSAPGRQIGGWRGNGTGVWTHGNPPLDWQRTPHGALEGMRSSADAPAEATSGSLVEKGQIRNWLALGPFPVPAVESAVIDFDPLGAEGELAPTSTGQVGTGNTERRWTPVSAPPDDPLVFGEAAVPWLDLKKAFGFRFGQVAYAHAHLYSPRGGRVRFVVDHSWGLKAWVNGELASREPDRRVVLGNYPSLSRIELEHVTTASSVFPAELKAGWNRLLLKVGTPLKAGHEEMALHLRVMDPPDVAYESRNIHWMAELPGRSTSTPILVGDKILVTAEPDELLCLDKGSGKVLWSAMVNLYESLTAEERSANPAIEMRVAPLTSRLHAERDALARVRLRGQIHAELASLDRSRFMPPRDGHFDAHFGIVGYTMPTPVSDGENIYVWNGMGVAACFSLDGQRRWITRVSAGDLTYASTPALADGVLVVFLNRLFGIDARTGEVLWEQPRINKNTASLLALRLADREVVMTQEGEVVSPRDGKLLYRPQGIVKNDTGWTPGVAIGDLFYLPKYGVKQLSIVDFSGQSGDSWRPRVVATMSTPAELDRRPDGGWLDRSTAASPLVVGRYAYMVDMYSELCVFDLEAQRLVHHRRLPLEGFTHYNALAVAASPALVNEHILIMDNQGTTLVLTPGPEPQLVRRNVLATQLERRIPLPSQEVIAYAPPIVDGDRLYLRGERYLYCIAP